jgi:hypothetical protein
MRAGGEGNVQIANAPEASDEIHLRTCTAVL